MTGRADSFMQMYWGDYARDTGHLNNAGHGAYLMLIKHYWCSGSPLPDDDAQLWRIACCDSIPAWKKVRAAVERFFQVAEGRWRHKRIDIELVKAAERYEKRSQAGALGNAKRWQRDRIAITKRRQSDPNAVATITITNNPLKPPLGGEDAEFQRFWQAYPHRGDHADPKKPARKSFDKALRLADVNAELLIAAAARYAETVAGRDPERTAQAVTWLNQARWEQYAAPAVAAPTGNGSETLVWEMRLRGLRERNLWLAEQWGPRPGEPGCKVPADLL